MARKRRVERKLDEPPPFDAADFLRKEVSDAKLTFVTFTIALMFTAASIGAYHAVGGALAILIGFAGLPALKFLYPLFRIDLNKLFPPKEGKKTEEEEKLEKRGRSMRMVSQFFTYFFTWLAIFVVALNPPFADVSGPAIKGLKATQSKDVWHLTDGTPPTIKVNKSGVITIVVRLVDPSGIKDSSVMFHDKSMPTDPGKMMTMTGGSGSEKEYSYLLPPLSQGESIRFYITSQDSQVQSRSATTPEFRVIVA
ncbi:MAG TPA: hypothetical protein VI893_06315 [Thermoplasmata archaeon]|nr:hypothetical protein [Thermoplasmata archaeon]